MPKCGIKGCKKSTRYKNTKETYCPMHLARIKRHGHSDLQTGFHKLEKLPHPVVDDFIRNNHKVMIDIDIAQELRKKGFKEANQWLVRYRRRKLGIKKYLYGEIKKHKAWIRMQAIKKYGDKCEICGYGLAVESHHILPRKMGGLHEINNLMVLCPNCHALITRRYFNLKSRKNIPTLQKKFFKLRAYPLTYR